MGKRKQVEETIPSEEALELIKKHLHTACLFTAVALARNASQEAKEDAFLIAKQNCKSKAHEAINAIEEVFNSPIAYARYCEQLHPRCSDECQVKGKKSEKKGEKTKEKKTPFRHPSTQAPMIKIDGISEDLLNEAFIGDRTAILKIVDHLKKERDIAKAESKRILETLEAERNGAKETLEGERTAFREEQDATRKWVADLKKNVKKALEGQEATKCQLTEVNQKLKATVEREKKQLERIHQLESDKAASADTLNGRISELEQLKKAHAEELKLLQNALTDEKHAHQVTKESLAGVQQERKIQDENLRNAQRELDEANETIANLRAEVARLKQGTPQSTSTLPTPPLQTDAATNHQPTALTAKQLSTRLANQKMRDKNMLTEIMAQGTLKRRLKGLMDFKDIIEASLNDEQRVGNGKLQEPLPPKQRAAREEKLKEVKAAIKHASDRIAELPQSESESEEEMVAVPVRKKQKKK